MFNPVRLVIDGFVSDLEKNYRATYSTLEPAYPGVLAYAGHTTLELICNSDAPYHDVHHTIMVTQVGQEILKGRHLRYGGVTPTDWLFFVVSLLCHDIGYVRGICQRDQEGRCITNPSDESVEIPAGATDAYMAPYHVERAKMFVRKRFQESGVIDAEVIAKNIEHTRFPVPELQDYQNTSDYPGLVRAADLIGQLADPFYMRRTSALFVELQETGVNEALGYRTAADLRAGYPSFFWDSVAPYIGEALDCLRMTLDGKLWVANLYAHIFAEEHKLPTLGPQRGQFSRQR